MGAWIEILPLSPWDQLINSRSLHGSVDWNISETMQPILSKCRSLHGSVDWNIEFSSRKYIWICRSLHGSVDWNSLCAKWLRHPAMSLPSWERGLKYRMMIGSFMTNLSLPSWERGLKYAIRKFGGYRETESLPSWERGLKCNEGLRILEVA